MTEAAQERMRLLTELRIVNQFLLNSHARSIVEEAELKGIADRLQGILRRIEAE